MGIRVLSADGVEDPAGPVVICGARHDDGVNSWYDAVVVGALAVGTNVVVPDGERGRRVGATFTDVVDCIGQAGGDSARGFAALGYRTAAAGHVGDDPHGGWVRA